MFFLVNTAKSHTTKGARLASNMQKTVDRIENKSKDLRDRIEALKRKIKQTRQYASSVSNCGLPCVGTLSGDHVSSSDRVLLV